mmetsp:Transcript_79818/g.193433  ORF Transcript_79818/g.193433 Transcript_79818/m.193433 type:complete len:320 (+) Transcript_79818:444-1403(+)
MAAARTPQHPCGRRALPSHARQRCSSDALANALHVLAGRVEFDASKLGKIGLEDLLCHVHHDLPSSARRDTAKDQYVLDVQVLAILGDGIAHIHANGLIDLADFRLLCRILHRGLHLLQALSVGRVVHLVHVGVVGHHVLGQVHASLLRQAGRSALAEVHGGVTPVRRPRIRWAFGIHVQGAVRVLVDPACERTVRVDVARALAAAKGDTEEAALPDHLAPGHGRDLAVVDDLDGHTAKLVVRNVLEDRHHALLVDVGGHVGEAVAPGRLALVRDGPRSAAADGFDLSRELGRHLLHGLNDEVVVVLRVGVGDIPLRLL